MTYLKKTALAVALTATISSPAFAQDSVCDPAGGQVIAEFEEAKDKFLRGNFVGFQQVMAKTLGKSTEALKQPLQRLSSALPDGFTACHIIAQRIDVGGVVQEVVAFDMEQSKFPITLYLLGIPTKDGLLIGNVSFDANPSNVLDKFK